MKLALDLHVNFCLFVRLSVCLSFRSFFQGVSLDDILASDSGSGNLLIRLGVQSLAEQCHTQIF